MKIINTIIVGTVFVLSINAQDTITPKTQTNEVLKTNVEVKPYYQGDVLETIHSGGYTYLLIDEQIAGYNKNELKSFWISVTQTQAKVGDYVRFKKELAMKDFKSKTLNRTFPELMFASDLEYRVSK